ncbi:hypothetical protein [Palaeococcus ferrophilus]|uniref:hypothetical protein n=1 Tax=Palaeococcus ferrophilus TaxID=83868 RepID=UPI00064F5163|nr:hypothetical protein [Palaeococcus ferrophilus]
MGAVIKGKEREFSIRPDSWYLVIYFNEGLQYLPIPSSRERDLERLALLAFLFELSKVPYIVFGVTKEGVYELGREFFERLRKEYDIDPRARAKRDALSLLNELERMEEFYTRLGFLEDLEEIMDIKKTTEELLEKLKKRR